MKFDMGWNELQKTEGIQKVDISHRIKMHFLLLMFARFCIRCVGRMGNIDQYCQYEPYLDLHHGIMYVSDWHGSKWSNQLVPRKWLAQGPEHDQAVVGSVPQFREDHPLRDLTS